MKPRIVTIELEVSTDMPINEIKNLLTGLIEDIKSFEDFDYEFGLVEKVKVNVIRDTK